MPHPPGARQQGGLKLAETLWRCRVYVRNLEESIKIPTLKQSLEAIFSQYGDIIDIVAKKSLKAKGQAFVVFDSTQAAENAIREVQAFPLFNKPMVLAFARTRSDATVKREAGGEDSREFEAHKRRRLAEKGIFILFSIYLLLLLSLLLLLLFSSLHTPPALVFRMSHG